MEHRQEHSTWEEEKQTVGRHSLKNTGRCFTRLRWNASGQGKQSTKEHNDRKQTTQDNRKDTFKIKQEITKLKTTTMTHCLVALLLCIVQIQNVIFPSTLTTRQSCMQHSYFNLNTSIFTKKQKLLFIWIIKQFSNAYKAHGTLCFLPLHNPQPPKINLKVK